MTWVLSSIDDLPRGAIKFDHVFYLCNFFFSVNKAKIEACATRVHFLTLSPHKI